MRFMFLIYADEKAVPPDGSPEQMQTYQQYLAFTKAVQESGAHLAGDRLASVSAATTVRIRDGQAQNVDGPFAETKEQLGGYYILDCRDQAQALELAAQIPGARLGAIEVRPIMEMG